MRTRIDALIFSILAGLALGVVMTLLVTNFMQLRPAGQPTVTVPQKYIEYTVGGDTFRAWDSPAGHTCVFDGRRLECFR